ncbi:hypothetical protein DSO57_1037915 [Entomophthora muscae]|uniref:Uncharacterized protein n=1 Tax=Entomophthora muscae TaxID=34485 RepID=A0ACC2UIW3_9FUNG|nr:hypothetical protein DSO57_1037915 [Entomophthora muscae]
MSAESSHSVISETVPSPETVPSSPIDYCSFPRPLKPLTLNKPVFQEKVDWVKALEKVEAIHPLIHEHLLELCTPKENVSSIDFDERRFEAETEAMNLYLPQANTEDPPLEASSKKRSRGNNSCTSELDSEEENRVEDIAAKEVCPPVSFRHFRKKMRMISRAKEDTKTSSVLLSSPRHPNEIVFPYLDLIRASSTSGKVKDFRNRKSRLAEQKASMSRSNL